MKKDKTAPELNTAKIENIVETKPPIINENVTELKPPAINDSSESELDSDIDKFNERTANFEAQPSGINLPSHDKTQDIVKMKMFLNFGFWLLSGFATFVFNLLTKYEVSFSDMKLTQIETESLSRYLQSDTVIVWINKIPSQWIFVLHTGYIFHQKHSGAIDRMKAEGTLKLNRPDNKKENKTDIE